MENGVQAFKIAASILIFVLAISITISSFTSVTQALNRIFNMQNEDEYVTMTEIDPETGNQIQYYLNFVRFSSGVRQVGTETIIPSIYRAYRENYSIYFYHYDESGDLKELYLYEKDNGDKVNYIDLEKEVYASVDKALESVNTLLKEGKDSRYLNNQGLYEYLSGKVFTEMIGEYYMDDLSAGGNATAEVNKIKKRVIVYIQNQ